MPSHLDGVVHQGRSPLLNRTAGIDLAKNVFAVHGVNETGKAELVRTALADNKLPS
jgi:hypothetical protein